MLSKVFVEAFQRRRRSVWLVRRHLCRKVSSIDLHRCLTARLVNCGICACRVYALVSDDICAISLDILVSYFLCCIYCRVPCIYHKSTFSTLPSHILNDTYSTTHTQRHILNDTYLVRDEIPWQARSVTQTMEYVLGTWHTYNVSYVNTLIK